MQKSSSKVILPALMAFLTVMFVYSRGIPKIPVGDRSLRNPVYLTQFLAQESLQAFNYGAIGFFLILLSRWVKSRTNIDIKVVFPGIVALGALTQLYPSPDSYHIWWVVPIFLASGSLLFDSHRNYKVIPVLVSLIVINCVSNFAILSTERVELRSAALKGMYGSDKSMDEALMALERYVPPRSAVFLCDDGLYAANTNGFLSNNRLFVSWPKGIAQGDFKQFQFLVLCAEYKNRSTQGFRLIWKNEKLSLFQRE